MRRESTRMRVVSSLTLIALSLVSLAGVNVSRETRSAILTVSAVVLAVAVVLIVTARDEWSESTDAPAGHGRRTAVLAVLSAVAWGGLGLAAAKEMWLAAFAALVAAAVVSREIWVLIRGLER